jgi:demethylmenaquinone methyltransferase / 2-methoxy-6-polyprenyl-1,4-benzoquinol methylase
MTARETGESPDEPRRLQQGEAIKRMFGEIAHRYDFLNHFLSASIDRRWRSITAAKIVEHVGRKPHPVCLDLCAGTADLAIALRRRIDGQVVASDFCHPMLVRGLAKVNLARLEDSIRVVEADAQSLPFPGESFDAVAIAFGLRNLEDLNRGLREMHRVLRPGGILAVLEFSRPVAPIFREAFGFYFHHVLPRLGALISGQPSAYKYLPESVRQFPPQRELAAMITGVDFHRVGYRNLSGGIAALHWGVKP